MEHTKEPWELRNGHDHTIIISSIDTLRYAIVNGLDANANAKRIVSCVNACAGISNEVLAGALHHGVDPLQKRIAKITADVLHAIEALESCNYSASNDCYNAKRVREALATLLEIKAAQ